LKKSGFAVFTFSVKVLSLVDWQKRAQSESADLEPFVAAHLDRRRRAQTHPVWDFLFGYYDFKPSHLLRFSPGLGVELEGAHEFCERREWTPTPNGAILDLAQFPLHRLNGARETLAVLEATQNRTARHDCFGLHEWAMVYRAREVRHPLPLRLPDSQIESFVESQTLRCSHFDAVRFFTDDALPLNTLNPKSGNRAEFEQPGCIHANMDLYKWATKFAPWIASKLMIDAFWLAKDARELDMRASPYDLRSFGFEPITLETSEGRREYAGLQREVAMRAAPIRERLIGTYRELIEAVEGVPVV